MLLPYSRNEFESAVSELIASMDEPPRQVAKSTAVVVDEGLVMVTNRKERFDCMGSSYIVPDPR